MDADLLEVLRFLAISEQPEQCDIILCFGSHNLGTARTGAALHRQGIAPTVVVSGGPAGRFDPHPTEADGYHAVLTDHGVPPGAVIVERHARHTGDNVVLGMEAARRHGITVRAATLVALPTALRRCKATVALHCPEVRTFARPGLADFGMFSRDPRTAFRLVDDEMWRLRTYPDDGYMVPVLVPENVEDALERCRARFGEEPSGAAARAGYSDARR